MYAYYCLFKFRWLPSFFMNLDIHEKVLIKCMIDDHIAQEEKENKKMKAQSRGHRKR